MNFEPKAAFDPPYLQGLNPPQREAVLTTDKPLLVLSGAGTGKTRVLTTRIAHLLSSGLAFGPQILAVTFTNKAAQEMKTRLSELVGGLAQGVLLGTFHALCAKILRIHGFHMGLSDQFTILDMDDQLRVVKKSIQILGWDEKKVKPQVVLSVIQRWKDRAISIEKLTNSQKEDDYAKVYALYQAELQRIQAVDFGDLILHCIQLFQNYPEVLAQYHQQIRFILVDEYQDTNVAQYLWLRLLVQAGANLCCVGDDDQSIYGWRGAEVGNILKFSSDFPEAVTIRLEQNYRSTPHILGAASHLISHNQQRLGKTLWTDREEGEPVSVCGLWDEDAEARYVADEIEAAQRNGIQLQEMAVLVRASFQTRSFEERFLSLGIAYRVIGGLRFYERQEIRDALAYLRLITQPENGLAFERIINLPKRGIGPSTLQLIHSRARAENTSLVRATELLIESQDFRPSVRQTLSRFLIDLDRWQQLLKQLDPAPFAAQVLEESGYLSMWQMDKSLEAPGRLENLQEFIVALEEFETLSGFLDHVSLVMENSTHETDDLVTLMTLHSAKGLEFDTVFLPGWEEGLFPHARAIAEGAQGLEEERRLAYVGLTRAKRKAFITHTANRRVHHLRQSNIPSQFLAHLPKDHVDWIQGQANAWKSFEKPMPAYAFDASSSLIQVQEGKSLRQGQRVFHIKFGYGRVASLQGSHATVFFDKAGEKKVLIDYLEPAERV